MVKTDRKKLLVTGGGTGGHLYPAISIMEFIQQNHPGTYITFIGSERGMSRKLIPAMGIDFYTVKARGLAGSLNPVKKIAAYIAFLFILIPGFFKSLRILNKK